MTECLSIHKLQTFPNPRCRKTGICPPQTLNNGLGIVLTTKFFFTLFVYSPSVGRDQRESTR